MKIICLKIFATKLIETKIFQTTLNCDSSSFAIFMITNNHDA